MKPRIVGHTKRILRNRQLIRGTITVREQGRKKLHIVHYEYQLGEGYGWQQWGAPTEILALTLRAVEELCSHNRW